MAFEGWNFKVNGEVFPNSLIAYDSYKCTPDQIMDLDPYRDGIGLLHRTALPHTATSIEFSTPPLTLAEIAVFNSFFTKANRIECNIEYWNDNTLSYASGEFYVPDISYEKYSVDEQKNDILYKPIKITLTEY